MKKTLRWMCAAFCAVTILTTGACALSVEEAYDILRYGYVDKLPGAAKEAETLEELFSYTDEYTCYLTAEEYEAFLAGVESEESFAGIGAEIVYTQSGIEIVSLLPGGGAERAGLAAGDLVTAIDGISCANAGEEQRALLQGEEGTTVGLTVLRSDGREEVITVTRTRITITNTTVAAEDGVGYIDCNSFGTQTGEHFQSGVRKYDKAVRAWIVDLRGNGGGLTDAAVKALGTFSGSGELAWLVDRDGNVRAEKYTGADLTDKPLIALIDGQSASASEIFALGVSGTGTGIVIGERSYGKGVAQILFDETNCPYLSGDAVKVTAYRFYGANGNTSDRIGVLPTLYIPQGNALAAAKLLAGAKPAGGAYLHLVLNDCDFYVDAGTAEVDALRSILLALAPDAELYWGENGAEEAITPGAARERCGFDAQGLSFADVSESEYAQEINTLAAYRIVFGADGAFRPGETMTRAEVCALFAQAMDCYAAAGGYFTDVAADAWYAPSVNAMAALGLVSGVGNGRFAPDGTMTQEEFVTVLGRFAEFLNLDARCYLDAHPLAILRPLAQYKAFSSWAVRGIDALTNAFTDENGDAVSLYGADLAGIEPKEPVTREQAAGALCCVLRAAGALAY